jgi:hypothetical protein
LFHCDSDAKLKELKSRCEQTNGIVVIFDVQFGRGTNVRFKKDSRTWAVLNAEQSTWDLTTVT